MQEQIQILGRIRDVRIIAAGKGVKSRESLNRKFGFGHWRKMKGIGTAKLPDGRICDGEIHWYEAHGIGRVLYKIKRPHRWL